MRLERIVTELPAGFDVLRAAARAEGYRHIERLADEWTAGTVRFDREGEALMAATLSRELAGVGGLTIDPVQPETLRMRRFYIRAAFRRNGIGWALAEHLLARARALGRRQYGRRKRAVLAIVGFRCRGSQWSYARVRVSLKSRDFLDHKMAQLIRVHS